ncbi:MAG: DUF799 family lipoprotein [Candidatus Alcyoniella australis]|nr:DUF799 family lipoprotein [Candidatus Alcyoniella australis]
MPERIAVMPVKNMTADMDAPEEFQNRTVGSVIARGYSVAPPEMVKRKLEDEGIYIAEELYLIPIKELGEIMDVDGILMTTVTEWDMVILPTHTRFEVGARFELYLTQSETLVWSWDDRIKITTPYMPSAHFTGNAWVSLLCGKAFSTLPKCRSSSRIPVVF